MYGNFGGGFNGNYQPNPYAAYGMQIPQWMQGQGGNLQQALDPQAQLRYAAALGGYLPHSELALPPQQAYGNVSAHGNVAVPARMDAQDGDYYEDEPPEDDGGLEVDDSGDEDYGPTDKKPRTARQATRVTPAARRRAALEDSEDEDSALAQRLQAEYNDAGSRPRRAAASAAQRRLASVVADEDEEVDEEEDEDEEAPENIGYRQAAPYGQQPAAYRQQQPAGYRQQQSVGHGQSAAYEQGYGQAYRQPDPYQGQDYQMAQRAALGLRVRPAQADHFQFAPEMPAAAAPVPKRKKGPSGRSSSYYDDDDDDDDVPRKKGRRSVSKVSYTDDGGYENSDFEDSEAERRERAKLQKEIVPAFMSSHEGLDDEVERVLGHRQMEGYEPYPEDPWATCEFHVKWKRWSYIHCSWDTRDTLSQLGGYKRVLNYMKRTDEQKVARKWMAPEEAELQDVERQMEEELVQQHMHVERIIAQRPDPQDGSIRYLVKWKGLPYGECTWESFQDIFKAHGQQCIDQFQEREARLIEGVRGLEAQRRASEGQRALLQQPDFLRAGQLRDYQLEGLNWLIYSWMQNNNCILADEMGLGKTIQCVSFIGYLSLWQQIAGPYLVVVPLSTVPNWIREFRKWLPQCNALVYVGDSKSREVIRAFEFYTGKRSGRLYKFDVLITTFELVLKDAAVLGEMKWSYLVVDEAHRLKNNESALYRELSTWQFKNKLLVTGTPLQNSMKELWALLHFLEPAKFPNAEDFDARHSLKKAEELTQLHTELRPHLLRRVIKDVEKSLPPKNERILRVAMSPLQKQYYKWILTRNFKELNKGTKGGGQISLLNIITELKKCCNHPFLFESAESDFRGSDDSKAVDRLVVSAGKMVLLDKLLRRLKETGHRVLIFSQMVRMLDIISDYMRLRGFQHQRLDGSTPAPQRHQAMEHFNAPGSTDFAFLLSTRAGGLGINLATADTVIIFDSDWNPQNDLQAMSRAHRIGQTETVNIYRFLTSGSVEEDILERAKQKMVLDHLVIQRMDTSGRTVLDPRSAAASAKQMFGKDELTAILRFGAEELFKEDEGTKEAKNHQLLTEDIDSILARAEVVNETDATHADAGGELLNAFNVATFKSEEDDAAFWNRLIPTAERAPSEEPEQLGIRAARLKTTDDGAKRAEEGLANGKVKKGKSKRGAKGTGGRKRGSGGNAAIASEAGPPIAGALLRIDLWPTDSAGSAIPEPDEDWPKALNRKEAAAFIRGVKRYGLEARLPEIAAEVGPTLEAAPPAAQKALWAGFVRACERVERTAAMAGEDPSVAVLDWFGVSVKAAEMPAHLQRMKTLARKIEVVGPEPHKVFRLDTVAVTLPKWGRMCDWTPHDDAMLLLGIYWHGLGHWDQLAGDLRLGLAAKLEAAATEKRGKNYEAPEDHKMLPKGSQLETRAAALLKKLQTSSQQPLTFGGRGRSGRVPSARTPTRAAAAAAAAAADGAMPPKKRGGYAAAHHHGANDSADRLRSNAEASTPFKKWEGLLGEEVMLHVKKLRLLQKRGDDIPKDKAIEKTRKYLTVVGNAIVQACSRAASGTLPGSKLSSDDLHSKLWQFVARFTENNLDGENLARIYSRVSKGHGARDAPADRDASAAAAGPSRADTADDDDYVAPDSSRRRSHSEAGTDDRRHQWDEDGGSYLEQHSHAQHQPGRRDWDRDRPVRDGWEAYR